MRSVHFLYLLSHIENWCGEKTDIHTIFVCIVSAFQYKWHWIVNWFVG